MIDGRIRGLSFDELREEEPAIDDLIAWSALIEHCDGRRRGASL
jgi:hypothetical protein